MERHGLNASVLALGSRDLRLWDLVAPKPEWQKTLQALAAVSDSVSEHVDASQRVVGTSTWRTGA
jgi:hypothetical protein